MSVYFIDEMLLPIFREYAGCTEQDIEDEMDCYCRVYGKYDKIVSIKVLVKFCKIIPQSRF